LGETAKKEKQQTMSAHPLVRKLGRVLPCGLVAFFLLVPASGQQKQPEVKQPQATTEKTQFPGGPGKRTFLQICSACHAPDNVIGKGYSEAGWTQVVGAMVQRGAQGTNEQFGAIVKYLAANFGPPPDKIDINTATVLELRNWLNLTQKQAEAVVSYRGKNGDFQSLDDLKNVPGINPHFWDLRKEHLTF
jgi:competence protein ComEA